MIHGRQPEKGFKCATTEIQAHIRNLDVQYEDIFMPEIMSHLIIIISLTIRY